MNKQQQNIMVEWMERHGDLSQLVNNAQGRQKKLELWHKLVLILNRVAGGPKKNFRGWSKSWSELKLRTKRKSRELKLRTKRKSTALADDCGGTGGGRPKGTMLTDLEERVAAIISRRGIYGGPVKETGFEGHETHQAHIQNVQEVSEESPPPSPEVLDEDLWYGGFEEDRATGNAKITTTQSMTPQPMSPTISEDEELSDEVPTTSLTRPAVRQMMQREDQFSSPISAVPTSSLTRPTVRQSVTPCEDEHKPAIRRSTSPMPSQRGSRRGRRARVAQESPFDRAASLFARLEERRLDLEQRRLDFEIERTRENQRLLNAALELVAELKPIIINHFTTQKRDPLL